MNCRFCFFVLALGMCSAVGFAQEKEYQVGKDGFEWYRIKRVINGETKYGAEDRYGNMIVPTEYSEMWYSSDENPLNTGFGPSKGKYMAWYNKSGKCVVPYSRGYTWIHKWDNDEFGTYYTFFKPDGGGILDVNGKEVVSVNVDGLDGIMILSMRSNGRTYYGLAIVIQKKIYGMADANGKIIVAPEYMDYSTAKDLAKSRITTTTNPLAGNRHETLAEAEGRATAANSSSGSASSSGSSSSNNSGSGTTTVVVEHHHDPVPVQEWQQCPACFGSGQCPYVKCGGSGWYYIGDRMTTCSRCHGSGKCTSCAGKGGQYQIVYR